MKISIFFFSGTGNTWWVTQKIKEIFEEKGHFVELYSIERKDLSWKDILPIISSPRPCSSAPATC